MKEHYRQRPDGRYYWMYEDLYGKRRELSSWDEEKLHHKVVEKRKELMYAVDTPDIPLQDYLYSWLKNTHINGKKPATKARYWDVFRLHIKNNELGMMLMKNINVKAIQGFYNAYMLDHSSSVIKEIHKLISPCLRYAYGNGDIIKDFSGLLTIPLDSDEIIQARIAKGSAKPLTVEQHLRFVDEIVGHPLEALFRTALDGGYRKGELLALTWADIDFNRSRITIDKNYSYTKDIEANCYKGFTVSTKNYAIRCNKIPKALLIVLLKHKQLQKHTLEKYGVEQCRSTLVFCTPLGTHLDTNNVNRDVKKVYEDLGINNVKGPFNKCFHDLRHTYATRQFEQGVEVLTVSKLLGHRDINTTLKTYIHVLDDLRDATADATDNFYEQMADKMCGKNVVKMIMSN